MITTTTLHTINITEATLKQNFYESFMDVMKDGISDSLESFEMDVDRLYVAIQDIDRVGFRSLFQEGYTMMLVDSDDMEFMERFLREEFTNQSLQIVIKRTNGDTEIILEKDISY